MLKKLFTSALAVQMTSCVQAINIKDRELVQTHSHVHRQSHSIPWCTSLGCNNASAAKYAVD